MEIYVVVVKARKGKKRERMLQGNIGTSQIQGLAASRM